MSTTLTAVAVSGYAVRVTLTVDPADPIAGPITVWRESLEGTRVPVRGSVDHPGQSDVWDDTEAPLNRQTWYVLVDAAGREIYTADPVIQAAGQPVLSDPLTGAWVHVTVVEENERRYPQRATVLDVEGRRQRIRIYDVEGSADLPALKLRTDTATDLSLLRDLFKSGKVLQLRYSCPGGEDAWIGLTGERSEQRRTMRISDWTRYHVLEPMAEEQPDPETRATGDTLQDLHNAVPGTLQDIADQWPGTLLDIASTDLGAI